MQRIRGPTAHGEKYENLYSLRNMKCYSVWKYKQDIFSDQKIP